MSDERKFRFFLDGVEVSEQAAKLAEAEGRAKLCGAASGGHGAPQEIPLTDPWMALETVSATSTRWLR